MRGQVSGEGTFRIRVRGVRAQAVAELIGGLMIRCAIREGAASAVCAVTWPFFVPSCAAELSRIRSRRRLAAPLARRAAGSAVVARPPHVGPRHETRKISTAHPADELDSVLGGPPALGPGHAAAGRHVVCVVTDAGSRGICRRPV
jgi:hypothetical protein